MIQRRCIKVSLVSYIEHQPNDSGGFIMKKGYVVLIVLIFAFAVAYVGIQAQWDHQPEVVISFDAAKGELPEGVAIDKPGIFTSAWALPSLLVVAMEQY
jgi:hypothetical protein